MKRTSLFLSLLHNLKTKKTCQHIQLCSELLYPCTAFPRLSHKEIVRLSFHALQLSLFLFGGHGRLISAPQNSAHQTVGLHFLWQQDKTGVALGWAFLYDQHKASHGTENNLLLQAVKEALCERY